MALTRGEDWRFPDARVRRDSTATVIVAGQGRSSKLLINGVSMTVLTPITKFMPHLPLAFLRHSPQRGLVICFGMGTSFRSMHSWGIETTAVELVPSVPRFFGDFHKDADRVLSSPRAHVVVDDGRRFLDRTVDKYDVVVIDPPPPVEAAGSSLLYTREFYESIRPHLVDGGIVQVWIPGAEPKVMAAFSLALHEVFPHMRAFASVEGWGAHLLASNQPIADRTGAEMAATMPPAARKDLVEWGPYRTPAEQFDAVLAAETFPNWEVLRRMAGPLTDDRPLNEYFLVRRWRQ
jgi:predicted membrane-bound spermidine synthase